MSSELPATVTYHLIDYLRTESSLFPGALMSKFVSYDDLDQRDHICTKTVFPAVLCGEMRVVITDAFLSNKNTKKSGENTDFRSNIDNVGY